MTYQSRVFRRSLAAALHEFWKFCNCESHAEKCTEHATFVSQLNTHASSEPTNTAATQIRPKVTGNKPISNWCCAVGSEKFKQFYFDLPLSFFLAFFVSSLHWLAQQVQSFSILVAACFCFCFCFTIEISIVSTAGCCRCRCHEKKKIEKTEHVVSDFDRRRCSRVGVLFSCFHFGCLFFRIIFFHSKHKNLSFCFSLLLPFNLSAP